MFSTKRENETLPQAREAMKTTPADRYFSLCVRERASWTCEYPGCGLHIEPPTKVLQCAHYDTRDIWSIRLDPLNAFCMCNAHHQRLDRNAYRLEFENIYLSVFGREKLEILREHYLDHAGRGKQYKQTDGKGEVAQFYKAQFEDMQYRHFHGHIGRIEFTGWI